MTRNGRHRRPPSTLPEPAGRTGSPHHRRVQLLGLLVLCGLATGATGAVIAVGSAELDIAPTALGTPDVPRELPRPPGTGPQPPPGAERAPGRPGAGPDARRAPVFRWPSEIARVPFPAGAPSASTVPTPADGPAAAEALRPAALAPGASRPGEGMRAGAGRWRGAPSQDTYRWSRDGAADGRTADAGPARGSAAGTWSGSTPARSAPSGAGHGSTRLGRGGRAAGKDRGAASTAASAGSETTLAAGSLTPVLPVTIGPPTVIGPVTVPPSGMLMDRLPPLRPRTGG